MINFLLAVGVFVGLFFLLFFSIKIGYRFAEWRNVAAKQNHNNIVKVVEATVFALLGLLVAFSFSGAYDRFENRKLKIIEEINSIVTAYDRISLLKPDLQPEMRMAFKAYVDERIASYHRLAEFHGFNLELKRLKQLQNDVWNKAIAAVDATNSNSSTIVFIPAINNMFEVANTRIMITRMHPPVQIFLLLIGLAAISAFLAGYNMSKRKTYSLVYTLCFSAITAFTLYVIIDLEFPRVGMIRIDAFDNLLVEARDNLS